MTADPRPDESRDAHLDHALRHAPDHDSAPPSELTAAILRRAREELPPARPSGELRSTAGDPLPSPVDTARADAPIAPSGPAPAPSTPSARPGTPPGTSGRVPGLRPPPRRERGGWLQRWLGKPALAGSLSVAILAGLIGLNWWQERLWPASREASVSREVPPPPAAPPSPAAPASPTAPPSTAGQANETAPAGQAPALASSDAARKDAVASDAPARPSADEKAAPQRLRSSNAPTTAARSTAPAASADAPRPVPPPPAATAPAPPAEQTAERAAATAAEPTPADVAAGLPPLMPDTTNPVRTLEVRIRQNPSDWSWRRDGNVDHPASGLAASDWLDELDRISRGRWRTSPESAAPNPSAGGPSAAPATPGASRLELRRFGRTEVDILLGDDEVQWRQPGQPAQTASLPAVAVDRLRQALPR